MEREATEKSLLFRFHVVSLPFHVVSLEGVKFL